MTDAPDLPPIRELTELLVDALGADGSTEISGGPYPSTALRFGDDHPVLVRTFHRGDARVNLPHGPYVDLARRADLDRDLRPIRDALAALVAEPLLSLADLAVALLAPALGLDPATVEWPGVTVPDEAWVRSEQGSVGLFHRADELLRVVVWIGSQLNELPLPDRASFVELRSWVPARLDRQRMAAAAAAAEQARLEALPRPTVAEVWEHLQAGHELVLGGGRWSLRYRLRPDGVLWGTTQDEGDVTDEPVADPDRALQAGIDFDPVGVRRALERGAG